MAGEIFLAFAVGGLICVLGQLLLDVCKFTPAHTMCALVVAGAVAGGFGIYDKLVEFAGAGASVPISSFGNALVQGALLEVESNGVLGLLTGIFEITSSGVSAAIVFGFAASLIFRPRS